MVEEARGFVVSLGVGMGDGRKIRGRRCLFEHWLCQQQRIAVKVDVYPCQLKAISCCSQAGPDVRLTNTPHFTLIRKLIRSIRYYRRHQFSIANYRQSSSIPLSTCKLNLGDMIEIPDYIPSFLLNPTAYHRHDFIRGQRRPLHVSIDSDGSCQSSSAMHCKTSDGRKWKRRRALTSFLTIRAAFAHRGEDLALFSTHPHSKPEHAANKPQRPQARASTHPDFDASQISITTFHIMPRVTESDEVFKKRTQVVDRPQTTDHNINDEYLRHPPHNTDVLKDTRWHPAKESAREPTEEQRAPTPSEGVGHKITPLEQMAAFTQEDSVLPE
ncbi:hypothetical protein CVT26_000502 [Gymnopilus dilepis]|uniref:Uncharacterized protein n=1 Tax=Gymnopilus dilepis TaxID=231916 RepID=A0A409VH41_9AGAR|nr:hypothetical protein CVT26_000502 [Gymnopilus dilepis]